MPLSVSYLLSFDGLISLMNDWWILWIINELRFKDEKHQMRLRKVKDESQNTRGGTKKIKGGTRKIKGGTQEIKGGPQNFTSSTENIRRGVENIKGGAKTSKTA